LICNIILFTIYRFTIYYLIFIYSFSIYSFSIYSLPSGWHLPTAAEWDALGEDAGAIMVNATFLDNAMWSVAIGQNITNSTGFNAIPVGYYDSSASLSKFRRYEEMAAFWTASDATDPSAMCSMTTQK